jgi:hypothetical protein
MEKFTNAKVEGGFVQVNCRRKYLRHRYRRY